MPVAPSQRDDLPARRARARRRGSGGRRCPERRRRRRRSLCSACVESRREAAVNDLRADAVRVDYGVRAPVGLHDDNCALFRTDLSGRHEQQGAVPWRTRHRATRHRAGNVICGEHDTAWSAASRTTPCRTHALPKALNAPSNKNSRARAAAAAAAAPLPLARLARLLDARCAGTANVLEDARAGEVADTRIACGLVDCIVCPETCVELELLERACSWERLLQRKPGRQASAENATQSERAAKHTSTSTSMKSDHLSHLGALLETIGHVKQTQLRMVRARGAALSEDEERLLRLDPIDVTRHFVHKARASRTSLFKAMSTTYAFDAHGSHERLYVVFIGVRLDAAKRVRQVPIDALRGAVTDIMEAEGRAFTDAMTHAHKRRRFGALSDALDQQSARAAPPDAQPRANVRAVVIVPAPLTTEAKKVADTASEWVTVFSHAELSVALDAHPRVPPQVFLRGAQAHAALRALAARFEELPVISRDDAAVKYWGGCSGDVCRAALPEGVVHWLAVV